MSNYSGVITYKKDRPVTPVDVKLVEEVLGACKHILDMTPEEVFSEHGAVVLSPPRKHRKHGESATRTLSVILPYRYLGCHYAKIDLADGLYLIVLFDCPEEVESSAHSCEKGN